MFFFIILLVFLVNCSTVPLSNNNNNNNNNNIKYVVQSDNMHIFIENKTAVVLYSEFLTRNDAFLLERSILNNNCNKLILNMNNVGGNVFVMFDLIDTITILKKSGIHVTTIARGLVASASVAVFVLGDERIIYQHSFIMIHSNSGRYNQKLTKNQVILLNTIDDYYANIISDNTFMSKNEVFEIINNKDLLNDQIFYTSDEALKKGFATSIYGGL